MREIITRRLVLRAFRETDYDDLYEFLSQLRDDEFEGYPGLTYENGKKHLQYRVGSEEFYAVALRDTGKVIGNKTERRGRSALFFRLLPLPAMNPRGECARKIKKSCRLAGVLLVICARITYNKI